MNSPLLVLPENCQQIELTGNGTVLFFHFFPIASKRLSANSFLGLVIAERQEDLDLVDNAFLEDFLADESNAKSKYSLSLKTESVCNVHVFLRWRKFEAISPP